MGQGLLWQRMWNSINGISTNDNLNNGHDIEPRAVGFSQLADSWKKDLLQLSKEAQENESPDADSRPGAPAVKRRKVNSQQATDSRHQNCQRTVESVDDEELDGTK